MTLPRPPIAHENPVPNQPFEHEEVYYVSGPLGEIIPLGNGLVVNPEEGSINAE
jgi:hypothetical protein